MIAEHVSRIGGLYVAASGLSESTVSLYAAGQGQLLARLRGGADITGRRAMRILRWFSDHWPDGVDWPCDIPRPPAERDAA